MGWPPWSSLGRWEPATHPTQHKHWSGGVQRAPAQPSVSSENLQGWGSQHLSGPSLHVDELFPSICIPTGWRPMLSTETWEHRSLGSLHHQKTKTNSSRQKFPGASTSPRANCCHTGAKSKRKNQTLPRAMLPKAPKGFSSSAKSMWP